MPQLWAKTPNRQIFFRLMDDDDELAFPRSFGSTSSSGFNASTRAFKANPTIDTYVRLRREHPTAEIEVAIHGGIDQLFYMESELARCGISADEFVSVFDANLEAISKFSMFFLEKIIEARELKNTGETHLARRGLAVPEKLIDWFVTCALDAMSWNDQLEMNRDLIVLIRERLGGPSVEYEIGSQIHQRKQRAAMIAGNLKAQGHTPSFRDLGKIMNVAPTTIMRWFEPGEFAAQVDIHKLWFNSDGSLRDLFSKEALQSKERAQRDAD